MNINNNTVPNNIQRLAENRFLNLLPENQLQIISTLNIPTINQVLESHSTMRAVVDRLPQNLLNQINAHDRENNVIYRGDDGHVRINLGDDTDVQGGITALMAAARDGSLERVNALLGVEGIEVNQADNFENTALMYTAQNGHTESVTALIAGGANVNHANVNGDTALMEAARYGHTESVTALIAADATVDQANVNGATALRLAARYGHTESVTALRNAGAIDRVSESSCCVIS